MKRILLVSLLLVLSLSSFAQQNSDEMMNKRMDSIKNAYLDEYALRYPLVRQAGISVETIAGGKMQSKLNGNDFFDARMQFTRVSGHFNVPIAHIKKFSISASVGMFYQRANISDVTIHDERLPVQSMGLDNTTLSASLNITRVDSLFRRPVVYSVRVAQLIDPTTGKTRFSGSGVFSMTLKKTENSTFGVGAFILLDPASPVPFAPYFSYYHKFKKHKLEFILDPPVRVALRKELSPNQHLSLFTNLGGSTVFFQYNNQILLPKDQIFSTLELKSGLLYEQRLTGKMVLGISTGVSAALDQKSRARNDFKNEPFMRGSQVPLPYVNVGVTFLPFWTGLSR
jgi:hypothetical protein